MSEIGSPAAEATLSPGSVEDVHIHIDSSPATHRQQVISSSLELRPATTNPLYEHDFAQVNEQHSYARWRYDSYEYATIIHHPSSSIHETVTYKSGRILGEFPLGMLPAFHERAAITMGRYLMHNLLCRDSRVQEVRYDGTPGIIDFFFNMHHVSTAGLYYPATVSTRLFATLDMGSMPSLNWSMGFDMVYDHSTLPQCRIAWIHSSRKPVHLEDVPIPCDLVIVDEHELEPFPWPVDIDSVAMAHSLNLRFIWSRAKVS
jgi:hypothetical protein